jgi:hypothetical protein
MKAVGLARGCGGGDEPTAAVSLAMRPHQQAAFDEALPEAARGHVGVPGVIGACSACVFVALAVRRVAADGGAPVERPAVAFRIAHRTARFAARWSLFLLIYTLLAQPEFRPPGVDSAVPTALVVTMVITVVAYELTRPVGASRAVAIVRRPLAAAARPPLPVAPHERPRVPQDPRPPSGNRLRSAPQPYSPDRPRQEYS